MASGKSKKLGASFRLLWTNPAPENSSTGFPAQTVNLDLSKYNAVLIVFLANANLNRQSSVICPKVDGDFSSVLLSVVPGATNARTRNAYVSDSGVRFAAGYTATSVAATSCVPYQIYGIQTI